MRVLVCGDRNWQDRDMIYQVLDQLPRGTIIVHGAARGADRMAGEIADDIDGLRSASYSADWDTYGRSAGPIRNQQMLDSGIDLVFAFHDDFEHSKGTGDMVRRAMRAGVPVEFHAH